MLTHDKLPVTVGNVPPSLSLGFSDETYHVGLKRTPISDAVSFTRATPKWAFNAAGQIVEYPANTPVYQYDPVTGENKGLLIEEQRTNLMTFSEQPSQKFSLTGAGGPTWESATDSAGISFEELREGLGDGTHMGRWAAIGFVGTHSLYFYAKRVAGQRNISFYVNTGVGFDDPNWTSGSRGVLFDLGNGTVKTASPGWGGEAESLPGGVVKCRVIFPAALNGSQANFTIALQTTESNESTFQSYQGDGVSGVAVGGFQLEAASTPSSYIPTEDAQVTRAVDNVSRELGAEFNPEEFTLSGDARSLGRVNNGSMAAIGNGSNGLVLRAGNGRWELRSYIGTGDQEYIVGDVEEQARFAFTYNRVSGATTWAVNGQIGPELDAGQGLDFSELFFGNLRSTTDFYRNPELLAGGYTLFPRALTDQELITLTTMEA